MRFWTRSFRLRVRIALQSGAVYASVAFRSTNRRCSERCRRCGSTRWARTAAGCAGRCWRSRTDAVTLRKTSANVSAAMVSAPMLLVPIRTTAARRRVRGIDGVEYVARVAARRTGATVLCALEPLGGDAQRGRSRDQRRAARGRFWCDAGLVRGRSVTLVDDVCTTGTTLEDCAAALRAAGAVVSQALVVAVANDESECSVDSSAIVEAS